MQAIHPQHFAVIGPIAPKQKLFATAKWRGDYVSIDHALLVLNQFDEWEWFYQISANGVAFDVWESELTNFCL